MIFLAFKNCSGAKVSQAFLTLTTIHNYKIIQKKHSESLFSSRSNRGFSIQRLVRKKLNRYLFLRIILDNIQNSFFLFFLDSTRISIFSLSSLVSKATGLLFECNVFCYSHLQKLRNNFSRISF